MGKFLIAGVAALLISTSAFAAKVQVTTTTTSTTTSTGDGDWSGGGDGDWSGGDPVTTPIYTKAKKANAGVGNSAEGAVDERTDRDPGNSAAHNQAGKNYARPNSPASSTNIP